MYLIITRHWFSRVKSFKNEFEDIMLPKSWLSVHQCQTEIQRELWRRKKEWLYYFARQRGNTIGEQLKNCFSPSSVSRERLYSQAGVCGKDQGINSLTIFFLLHFLKDGVVDKIRVYAWS